MVRIKKVLILGGSDGLSVRHAMYQIVDQLLEKNYEVSEKGRKSE